MVLDNKFLRNNNATFLVGTNIKKYNCLSSNYSKVYLCNRGLLGKFVAILVIGLLAFSVPYLSLAKVKSFHA